MATKLSTVSEFAAAARTKPKTVRRWLNRKLISSVKLGGRRLIPANEIERLIAENYAPADDQ